MSDVTRAQAYLDQLVAELENRGLEVAAKFPVLAVRNPAASGEDPQGRAMSPGLGQRVLIRDEEGRGLTWCWEWPGMRPAERGAATPEPEVEPMCPAENIDQAANRITNVVRLREPELAEGGGDV